MPIRPENRARYPDDWAVISRRIRFDRAGGRCECDGRCRSEHHKMHLRLVKYADETEPRCPAIHGQPHPWRRTTVVVLTTAHLNHTPEDCTDGNLMAMCQSCHLNYDRAHHAETRAGSRGRARAALRHGGEFRVNRIPPKVTPRRIQRQRTKGWRMPEGAVYVGRPTAWGNPYIVGSVVEWFPIGKRLTIDLTPQEAVDLFRAWMEGWEPDERPERPPSVDLVQAELGGHDLACWCPLDQPCHADVLLELANPGARQ